MHGRPARLSVAESEVLRVLWGLGRASVQAVCGALPPARDISYATVQTLLRRLDQKGYVSRDKGSKAHVFYPRIPRERVLGQEVCSFVARLFGGDPLPLMLHLAQTEGVAEEDIERLRKLIDAARQQRRSEP